MMASNYNCNPLFNHLVLEKIVAYLDLNDLKCFRLVCSFWNSISLPRVTKSAELHLEGIRLEQFLHTCSTSELGNQASVISPFENYTIKINSSLSFEDNVRTMWEKINVSITHLTLHVTTKYASRELKWLLLYHLPSLRKIKLVVTKYWGEVNEQPGSESSSVREATPEETEIIPNLELKYFQLSYLGSISMYGIYDVHEDDFRSPIEWDVFFKRFPKISYLSLIGLESGDISKMINALESLPPPISPSSKSIPSNLEILDENIYPETPNDDHLNRLSTLSHHTFESLHLEISPMTTTSNLDRLFQNNSRTLQSLRLRRYPHPYLAVPITLTGVQLNSVNFLEVSDAMLQSFSFLPYFPSLKILHIILRDYRSLPCCSIVQNTQSPNTLRHSNLQVLYIEPPLVDKECTAKLSTFFPNLESLRVRADDDMLGEICNQCNLEGSSWCKSLKSLYITSWDGLTDEGLTGIKQRILQFWGSYSGFRAKSFEVKSYRDKPYIGNIKGLTNLTIEMWSDYENHICDWSVYYGILDLHKLEEITLIRCGISLTALKIIPVPDEKKNLIA